MERDTLRILMLLAAVITLYSYKIVFYNKPLFEVFFPINYFTMVLIMLMVTIIIKIITWLRSGNKFFLGFKYIFPIFTELKPGHICIYGATGSGKTTFTKNLIKNISRKIPVLILDWHGEYNLNNFLILKPGDNFSINPLTYYSGELSEHIEYIVDLFGDVYKFSEPQRYMFRLALKRAFNTSLEPTIAQILEIISSMALKSYWDYEIKMAIKRRLSTLTEGRIGKAFSRNSISLSILFSKNMIIDLSVFRSIYIKKLYAMLILKILYDHFLLKSTITDKVTHITVIEEAWNIIPYRRLDTEPSIGERLFAELRKYGEFIISVSQFPSETAWSIMKNARMLIIFRLPPRESEMLTGSKVKIDFSNLKPGVFFFAKNGYFSKIYSPPMLAHFLFSKNYPKEDRKLILKIKIGDNLGGRNKI